MAAPIVGISFFALFVMAPVSIIVVLGVFKLIAWAGNAMLGRNSVVQSRRDGLGLRHMVAGAVPICLIVLLLLVVKTRSVQSVQVYSTPIAHSSGFSEHGPVTIVHNGAVLAAEDLADARQEILQAVQTHGGQIPVDFPIAIPAPVVKPAPEPPLPPVEPVAPLASLDETPGSPVVDESVVTTEASDATEESVTSDGNAAAGDSTTEPAGVETVTATVSTAEVTEEPPATENTATENTAEENTAATTPSVTPEAETPEQRQARLTELASHISPWIRSLLKEAQPEDSAVPTDVAEAVESSDKQIVVFQLAGPIRQKYALIPLTPAFNAAMSPVTPFLANGSLESIAESLAAFLKQPAEAPAEASAAVPGNVEPTLPQSTPATNPATATVALAETTTAGPATAALNTAEQLPAAFAEDTTPEWVDHPAPHQFVVRSDALFPEESPVAPLNKAINEVLPEHLKLDDDSLAPALRAQARLVKLELDEKTSQACVVKTFERLQSVGKEGSDTQNMRFVYALVELPESVKAAAVQTVQSSLQRDRVTGLAVIVVLAWLAICAASVVVRLWGRGGFFRKMIAIPILCLICIPLLLLAIGTGAATAGIPGSKMPRYPWADSSKPIRIQL
jgi:hypothetical protein